MQIASSAVSRWMCDKDEGHEIRGFKSQAKGALLSHQPTANFVIDF